MATVPTLAPVNPPLGPQVPDAKFYSPQQITLALRERVFSFTGDDFTVQTADGTPICKCKAALVSLRGKKKFTDMQGNEIFTLSNKLALQKSFKGEAPDPSHNFEIAGHFKLMGSKSSIHFKNASDGKQIELGLEGKWTGHKAEITWEGRPVAAINREFFNARNFFGGKDTVS